MFEKNWDMFDGDVKMHRLNLLMTNTVHVIFVSTRRRKEAMPGASLTDDNAVMAEIAGAVCTVISAMLY